MKVIVVSHLIHNNILLVMFCIAFTNSGILLLKGWLHYARRFSLEIKTTKEAQTNEGQIL